MTNGTVNLAGAPQYVGTVGRTLVKSWSGLDRPPTRPENYPPRTMYTVPRTIYWVPTKGRKAGIEQSKTVVDTLYTRSPHSDTTGRRPKDVDHPYTLTLKDWRSTLMRPRKGLAYNRNVGSDWAWSVFYGGNRPMSEKALFTANDHNELLNKLYTKVRGTDFNMGILLGEGHKTLAMISDNAIRVAKGYYHLRHGDISGALRSLKEGASRAPLTKRFSSAKSHELYPNFVSDVHDIAGKVLEFQYGVRPLLNDVYNAAGMLASKLELPFTSVMRVGIQRKVTTPRVISGNYWNNAQTYFGPGGCKVTQYLEDGEWIKATFTEADIPSIPSQLGLYDPLSVMWELTPYSFVADWFIPIGPALEARTAASSLKGQFVTSRKQVYTDGNAFGYWGTMEDSVGPMSGSFTGVTFSRTISSTLTEAVPTFKPLSKVFSMEHTINAIALVASSATAPLPVLRSSIQRHSARQSYVDTNLWGSVLEQTSGFSRASKR